MCLKFKLWVPLMPSVNWWNYYLVLADGTCLLHGSRQVAICGTFLRSPTMMMLHFLTWWRNSRETVELVILNQFSSWSSLVMLYGCKGTARLNIWWRNSRETVTALAFLQALLAASRLQLGNIWSNHLKSEERLTPMNSNGIRQLNRKTTTTTVVPQAFFLATWCLLGARWSL